ncbi:MAG: hypothetical protein QQN63_00865 [Nitrosopumilus sp.]
MDIADVNLDPIEDETPREARMRLKKEFRKLRIRRLNLNKLPVKTGVVYSYKLHAEILVTKFEKGWGHKPKNYSWARLGKGMAGVWLGPCQEKE